MFAIGRVAMNCLLIYLWAMVNTVTSTATRPLCTEGPLLICDSISNGLRYTCNTTYRNPKLTVHFPSTL